MVVNGINSNVPLHEQQQMVHEQNKQANLEKEKLEHSIEIQTQQLEREKQNQEEEKPKEDLSRFVMNEYQLKELLFMMSAKGNTSSIEQLAAQLKKEKEKLANMK